MEYLTEQELVKLLTIAKTHSTRDHLMILMGYTHGLRAGEIVNIRLGDIVNDTLTVQRLKGSDKTTQELRTHKGNPLLDEVRGVKELLAARPQHHTSDALFLTRYGTKMTTRMFGYIFRRYAWMAGLPANLQHPHTLKHSLGTHMGNREGVNQFMIQKRLGHASINSTAKYVHPSERKIDAVVNTMLMEQF